MTYQNMFRSYADVGLRERIMACTVQEAWNNPTVENTTYANLVRTYSDNAMRMVWAVCVASDVAAAYESAVVAENPNPGTDPAVVTDGMIIANVQAKWPSDS